MRMAIAVLALLVPAGFGQPSSLREDVEEYERRAAKLEAADSVAAADWYKLGLWAETKGLRRAEDAFRHVIEIEPDHRAARRVLGYERVDGRWVSGAEAKREKGFVLAGGRWMLRAEADRLMREGLMKQADVTKKHRRRAKEIAEALRDDDPAVRHGAAALVRELPDAALVRPFKRLLRCRHVDSRILAVKTLGRVGDRVALPWLIHSSMYDANEKVRAYAFRAIKGFKDADVFYPYARALFSKSPVSRIQAAKALSALGDDRGVDVILQRVSIGIGESGRANIMVGQQNSYIQDFDVEIAQAAAIGDPIVQTIRDGVILDYQVLGGWGEQWIVREANTYAAALQDLTGRDYGKQWAKYKKFAEEQDYPSVRLR